MSWLTVAWSMCAAACGMMALLHLFLWSHEHRKKAYLLSAAAASGAAVNSILELAILKAASPATASTLVRWENVAVYALLIPLVWFIYVHFGTARRCLAVSITGLWSVVLIVNMVSPSNVVFAEVERLRRATTVWGEPFSMPEGSTNPWVILAYLATVLVVVYAIDALLRAWRRGDRQRAVVVGGGFVIFIIVAGIHVPLVHRWSTQASWKHRTWSVSPFWPSSWE